MTEIRNTTGGAAAGTPSVGGRIMDADGRQAIIVSGHRKALDAVVAVRLENGSEVVVPADVINTEADDACPLPFTFASLAGHAL